MRALLMQLSWNIASGVQRCAESQNRHRQGREGIGPLGKRQRPECQRRARPVAAPNFSVSGPRSSGLISQAAYLIGQTREIHKIDILIAQTSLAPGVDLVPGAVRTHQCRQFRIPQIQKGDRRRDDARDDALCEPPTPNSRRRSMARRNSGTPFAADEGAKITAAKCIGAYCY